MNRLVLYGLFCVTLIASCSRDKGVLGKKHIIGKWNIDRLIENGIETNETGSYKFTSKKFELNSYSYVVNDNEVYEVTRTLDSGSEDIFGYEIFAGSTELRLVFYDIDGRPTNTDIELMTKDILIFTAGNKYYLSK